MICKSHFLSRRSFCKGMSLFFQESINIFSAPVHKFSFNTPRKWGDWTITRSCVFQKSEAFTARTSVRDNAQVSKIGSEEFLFRLYIVSFFLSSFFVRCVESLPLVSSQQQKAPTNPWTVQMYNSRISLYRTSYFFSRQWLLSATFVNECISIQAFLITDFSIIFPFPE